MKELLLAQIKGRIQSYIAREKEPITKIVKYIKTMIQKHGITKEEIKQILQQVKQETIEPFLNPQSPLYRPERLERYKRLLKELQIE